MNKYINEILRLADKAYMNDDVPVGAIVVLNNKIIGRGYNRRMKDKNTLSHAELNAIKKASKKMGDWRLEECKMYVTLEPCIMCTGALLQGKDCRQQSVLFSVGHRLAYDGSVSSVNSVKEPKGR